MENQNTKNSSNSESFNQLDQDDLDIALATIFREHEGAFTMLETFGSDSQSDDPEQLSNDNNYNQDDSDFALATTFQEQEGAFTMLGTFESNSESDACEEFSNHNDYNYFEFECEEEFLEVQDRNDEEDEIDPDELSHEELSTLGEIIGVESRGLSSKEISSCLHVVNYQFGESKSEIDRCVVCQVEYEDGESLAAPCCEHLYHSKCICQWLQINKVCPICGTEISSSTSFS